jgi:hypothetical protein
LDEFWDGALFGDEIDHAEKFCADERLGEESGERRDAIDDNHGDVEESGFDSGGAAGDDSGVGGGEGVVGLVGDDAQGEVAGPALAESCCRWGVAPGGGGDDKLGAGFDVVDAQAGFAQHRQVLAKFGGAAAGKNRDERFFGMEVVSGAERGAVESWLDVTNERVTDEFCGDAGVGVELFFEGEDAQGLLEAAADDPYTPRPPCPKLGADVVGVGDFAEFEFAGEAEMEAGEIGEDGEGWFSVLRGVDEFSHGADEGREMAEDFGDTDDGDFGVVGDDVDAGGAHLRAAHAEDFYVGALLERGGEARGVHVARSFAGGE